MTSWERREPVPQGIPGAPPLKAGHRRDAMSAGLLLRGVAVDRVAGATVECEVGRARVRHWDGLDPGELVRAVEQSSRGTIHRYSAEVVAGCWGTSAACSVSLLRSPCREP